MTLSSLCVEIPNQESALNHDDNLRNLRERCQLKNIILNDEKVILKQTELVFLGHVVSNQGVRPSILSKLQPLRNCFHPLMFLV